MANHLEQDYHKECVKADRIKSLQISTSVNAPIDASIRKANQIQADYIGKLMIQIFTDAKRLTLSAWSWPIRYIASEASHAFSITNENHDTIPKNLSLQYINNKSHLSLMSCIVESDLNAMKNKIENCLALSLRVDGSIDRSQIDKIYVMAKIVTSSGQSELIFLGVKEQTEREAVGLFRTALGAMEDLFGHEFVYNVILMKTSSICTDGTNVNSGEQGGLWKFLEDEIQKIGSHLLLLKIWCAAHRADLAFGDLTNKVAEIEKILNICSRIASYFHVSAIRSVELKKIASDIGLDLLSMPKIFTVRWTEYSYQSVRAIIVNWRALVKFFAANDNAQEQGFYKYLTNIENLKKMAFVADTLFVFQRFHKKIQSNTLTLLSMSESVKNVIASLEKLKSEPIPSGFEDQLTTKIVTNDEKKIIGDIELEQPTMNTRSATTDIASFKTDVIDSLNKFLKERLQVRNENLLTALENFAKFENQDAIKEIHKSVSPDLNLASLYLQYGDLCEDKRVKELPLHKMLEHLVSPERIIHFREMATILARVVACTPHSADVERCISANNLLKTNIRSSLSLPTENKYLYIYFNMPVLEHWHPGNAITKWMSTSRRNRSHTTETSKSRKQAYFKGVFKDCDSDDSDDDQESESKSKTQLKVKAF